MSDIFIQKAHAGQETRRAAEVNTERAEPAGAQAPREVPQATSRASLLDLAAMPAQQPATLTEATVENATKVVHEALSAYYRDDLDDDSVRRLAVLVRQQLSIQTLSIVNAHALGLISMVHDIELM